MKQERQTTKHKDDEETNVALRRRNHKIKKKDLKNTYFNKRESEIQVPRMILCQKLTINHP